MISKLGADANGIGKEECRDVLKKKDDIESTFNIDSELSDRRKY